MNRIIIVLLLLLASTRIYAQDIKVTISGRVVDRASNEAVPFANIAITTERDSTFVTGTIADEAGRFALSDVTSGSYVMTVSYIGYGAERVPLLVGRLSQYLDVGTVSLSVAATDMAAVTVTAKADEVTGKMDKKTFKVADNIAQSGASVLDAMKNLPGVTTQDGKVQLRGSDKVMVLIDGKQTALTGFGGQSSLDNIPASAIEKIEIINNPSAKYDANGNAGIINIVYKKEKAEGLNGKASITGGLGALWVKKDNYPTIRAQYQATPKANASLGLNYRTGKVNLFLQADDLYTKTLNKNEFVDRYYNDGTIIKQQTVRNRTTNLATGRAGMDWFVNDRSTVRLSGMFSSEKILDRGDEPFFNNTLDQRTRLWRFLEDELKTTANASLGWEYKFRQPGRVLNANASYTYHRENEQYFFSDIRPTYTGYDSFKLISDEHVMDVKVDYVQPLRYGRFETGVKFRNRYIPVNMQFKPGLNSPLDTNAGGWANYYEVIPAVYGNYVYESKKLEVEAGVRLEYVNVRYDVNPNHNTYKSSSYNYTQPFPNMRLTYKLKSGDRLSLFYNRRVDRPNEVDIRIFPKYDDAGIVKVGNPALRPQYTNTVELGYKKSIANGYIYAAAYHKAMDKTITRIAAVASGSPIIYNVFQNTGKSYYTGAELLANYDVSKHLSLSLNMNGYQHSIDAYSVVNKYPQTDTINVAGQNMLSGNVKLNAMLHLRHNLNAQVTAIYLAPDIIPQGTIAGRFSVDVGVKKSIQKGKGELFLNATDIANTLRIKQKVVGDGFTYHSTNYYETQVIRLGYALKF